MNWPWLPLELYVHILRRLNSEDPACHDADIHALSACLQVNSIVRSAASMADIWKPYYLTRYRHCDPVAEDLRICAYGGDWRLLYTARRRLDSEALLVLDEVIARRINRHVWAKQLLSLDLWDMLELESQRHVPAVLSSEDGDDTGARVVPHALTRRFWAKSILGIIARQTAAQVWGKIKTAGGYAVSFEDGFSALSGFFGVLPTTMSEIFDDLSVKCREYLIHEGCIIDTDATGYSLADICTRICMFLHSQGYSAAEGRDFHSTLNSFPHHYTTSGKRTIPLSLVHVFVAVAHRLDINASPVNFPSRVLVHVAPADQTSRAIYVDVYGSAIKAILSVEEDIPLMLLRLGLSPAMIEDYISPSLVSQLLLRAVRNIIFANDEQPTAQDSLQQIEMNSATYAAMCVSLLLTDSYRLLASMKKIISRYSLDVLTFLPDTLGPFLGEDCRKLLEIFQRAALAEEEAAASKLCRLTPASRRYFVGMFVNCDTDASGGLIVGWEPGHLIDGSSIHGTLNSDSTYYSILMLHGEQLKVAEGAIEPMNPTRQLVEEFIDRVPTLGMYFGSVDLYDTSNGVRGRMLLSPEVSKAYPEDDAFGRSWISNLINA